MSNKEKLLTIVSKEETSTIKRTRARIEKRKFTRLSKRIALVILSRLDQLGLKQVQLAEMMNVSPQQVNKWVKGNENFTLETLVNLGEFLDLDLVQVKPLPNEIIKEGVYKENQTVYLISSKKVIKLPVITVYTETTSYNQFLALAD